MTRQVTGPLKWHGGKAYLASKIVALMAPHIHYVEPFAGGLSVLLAKDPEGVSEVANDLNGYLCDFWKTLQSPTLFVDFKRRVEAVPFSELEWQESATYDIAIDSIERAVAFFVRCRQSLAGRMTGFTGVTKTRTRRGMNNEVSAWLTAIEGLPAVHARLKRVLILNRDALDVIRGQDGKDTLFYLDPPYLHETRATTGEYAHEMTADQHRDLCALIKTIKGKVMLSGYPSDLYRDQLERHGWTRHDFDLPNNAAGGATKRRMTECVWCNFEGQS